MATELTGEPLASMATTRAPAIAAALARLNTLPRTTTGSAQMGVPLPVTVSHVLPVEQPVLATGSHVLLLPLPQADSAAVIAHRLASRARFTWSPRAFS